MAYVVLGKGSNLLATGKVRSERRKFGTGKLLHYF